MINKESIYQFLIVFLGMVSAYFISKLAAEQNIQTIFQWLIVISISIIVWSFSWYFNEKLLNINNKKLMKKYEFEKQLQGLWLERYEMDDADNLGYCLIDIIYDKESKSLHLKGNVYTENGNSFANWTSKAVYLDKNTKSILYIYDGEFKEERLIGDGYGKLDFSTSNTDFSLSGSGCFEDSFTKYKPVNFDIDKLDKKLCKEIGSNAIPERSFEKTNFIRIYHKYLTEKYRC